MNVSALIQTDEKFENWLIRLQCQFLSCFPVNSIQWELLPPDLTWEQQALILQRTRCHPLNVQHPIKPEYQLNFLKRLIQILERNPSGEVHDDIYNEYCKLQQQNLETKDDLVYKHYVLPKFNVFLTMQETKTFVGKGTTGLCTWQASLALTDFLLHNTEIVKGKNVIELGAGTGLCGMILMRCSDVNSVTMTDGSLECVELMTSNIKRNFQEAKLLPNGYFELNMQKRYLGAFYLCWDEVEKFAFNENFKPDLILAADVVYDNELFKELKHAIDFVFKSASRNTKMLLAATVRNEETLEEFLDLISTDYLVKDCNIVPAVESHIQWDRTTIVRILEITKNSNSKLWLT